VAERKFKIVILTSFEKTFKEAFRVGAYRFVTKPIHKEEIWEALSAVKRSLVGRQTVDVYRDKKKYSIRQKNIFYISGRGSETEVFTKASSYRSDYSLAEWERRLDEGMFYRCHRSYIVNLSKVEKIVDEKIHLSDGEVVLLSRRRRKDVEEKFEEYGLYYH
jgi:DNA-binding LytR/AlgR family response regulator